MLSAFDGDCINGLKIMRRWANCLDVSALQIQREGCACGRNARRMCLSETMRGRDSAVAIQTYLGKIPLQQMGRNRPVSYT